MDLSTLQRERQHHPRTRNLPMGIPYKLWMRTELSLLGRSNLRFKLLKLQAHTSQISEEQNHFQEMALSSSETCTVLEESPTMVKAPDKSAEAICETEPLASNFVEEEISNTVQDCLQPNEAPTEDKQSATLIQLTSITSKDTPDRDLQITKAQFLAQLAVLPVVQGQEKASTNDSADTRASSSETCTSEKLLEENSLVARLRSHLKIIGGRLLKNQCGECGRVLSSSAALESHVSLHTGRRPFSCTLCGKSFPDSKGLKRHGRVHRNGRIHNCQQCGKGFVYRFGLTKHLQMKDDKLPLRDLVDCHQNGSTTHSCSSNADMSGHPSPDRDKGRGHYGLLSTIYSLSPAQN
ncbi:hypothetical protein INR49_022991 [Caranx melampygus]|nr:hypothetical protein INR49_022991 [Caranx melampygus]